MKNIEHNKLYFIRLSVAVSVFILSLAAFYGVFKIKFFGLQFFPAFVQLFSDFKILSAVVFGILVLITLIFGRLYCSVLCPLGILQEIAIILTKKKNKFTKNSPLKYFIAAIFWGMFFAGAITLVRYIEPYSIFGNIFSFSIFGIFALVVLAILTVIKGRFFCTNICPVGCILGLVSKISPFNIRKNTNECLSCGQCERVCESGCINSKEKTVDNETCVKCFRCLEACPKKGMTYSQDKNNISKFSLKRRQVLLSAATLAVFVSVVKAGSMLKQKIKSFILPAGAVNKKRFEKACVNCNLCVQNCPNKIIKKSDSNSNTVYIDFSESYCEFDCKKCSDVCPAGAIKKLSLEEKQKTKIASAQIDMEKCVNCKLCMTLCPKNAISLKEGNVIIDNSICIGCGKCSAKCPLKAINITAVEEQKII